MNTTLTRKRIIAAAAALFAAGGLTIGALPAHADMDMDKGAGSRPASHKVERHIPVGPFGSLQACQERLEPDNTTRPATVDPLYDRLSGCYQHGSKMEAYYFDVIYDGWSGGAEPTGGYKEQRPPI